MDFDFTPEEKAFQQEVRGFLKKELPSDWRGADIEQWEEEGVDEVREMAHVLRKKMAAKGWLGMTWPKAYGGREASFIKDFILVDEMSYFLAPGRDLYGCSIVGPSILRLGTEEQKKEHLPRITRGEVVWCMGMSEPNAGSDLASLQTRAVEDGDYFVVNGQKIWTSGAHVADWCTLYVRTDPQLPKHRGISCLLVDLTTPGITRNPIQHMTGRYCFNEVFCDNVRVPKKNLLGEKNGGWKAAVASLDFERPFSVAYMASCQRFLDDLVQYGKEHPGSISPVLRHRLAQIAIEIQVGRVLSYRVASMLARNVLPVHEGTMIKMWGTELDQRLAQVGMQVLGLYGQLNEDSKWAALKGRLAHLYLSSIGATIAGGTSEMMRNTIALSGLGLPR